MKKPTVKTVINVIWGTLAAANAWEAGYDLHKITHGIGSLGLNLFSFCWSLLMIVVAYWIIFDKFPRFMTKKRSYSFSFSFPRKSKKEGK